MGFLALSPLLFFVAVYLVTSIIIGDFYKIPITVAFMASSIYAVVVSGGPLQRRIELFSRGASNSKMMLRIWIFLLAGAFAQSAKSMGSIDATVDITLSILPSNMILAGLFLASCFISLSIGTSVGTIVALIPIAVEISEKTAFPITICSAAVACGAMFGDNLSVISDTTIAAVKTQGCQMKDKFKENFFIVLPAAIISLIIFFLLTSNSNFTPDTEISYNIFQVIPYILVLLGAVIGLNVFIVLILGTVTSVVIGTLTGEIAVDKIFTSVGDGVVGMYDITVISIVVACIISLVREFGGVDYVLSLVKRKIKSKKGAELGISGLVLLVDACTANNTVAIVMTGQLAKDISQEYDISSKRSASLLDIFSSVGQGLIPYGAQLLTAAALAGISPFLIIPFMVYPVLMAVSAVVFTLIGKK